jgi:type I restriction-modification system DNA methylase subunit
MDTSKLKKFAQFARRNLIEQVQSKLKLVLADESTARREHPKAVKDLEQKLNQHTDKKLGEEQLIEQVAYTWFNRFCALRFMDVNQYNRIMVLSPISGQFQPEILAEAKAGHLDDAVFNATAREKIQGLLSGSLPSRDGQAEAYRLMIVAVCNDYYRLMPFLFQRIEDYTELLMPDDLLSGNSILAYTREAMTPENCESVESIGWLYQFYISEKKDQVFEGLKKNKKISPENIPAATQLFTPHWIVKYLVENSLGRLWMLNNPSSKVIEQMEYYIKPVEQETGFLEINSPENLKICDPACGSGHMLTYAYDLLYAIYLDANYDPRDIPELILTKNLYGIEIDERAAELAAFALSMKALKGNPKDDSNNRRRFFRNPVKPNICRLENVKIEEDALEEYIEFIGRDLFTQDLRITLTEFEEADNFGSLIQPTLKKIEDVLAIIESKNEQVDLFLSDTHKSVLKILSQAEYLSCKYQIVVANPPYMGGKGMNSELKKFANTNYADFKSDLYSMFIKRSWELVERLGVCSLVTIQGWLYAGTSKNLRKFIFDNTYLTSLVHIGFNSFPELNSKYAVAVMFSFDRESEINKESQFLDLNSAPKTSDKNSIFLERKNSEHIYKKSVSEFQNIPGSPVAYSASSNVVDLFTSLPAYSEIGSAKSGLQTGDNERFLRYCFEISKDKLTNNYPLNTDKKWLLHAKGGEFRRWYGNLEYCVDWSEEGSLISSHQSGILRSPQYYYKSGVTWSHTGLYFGARILPKGINFNVEAPTFFSNQNEYLILGALNSKVTSKLFQDIYQSLHFLGGDVMGLPYLGLNTSDSTLVIDNVKRCVEIYKVDWDEKEISYDFSGNPLINTLEKIPLSQIWKLWETICGQRIRKVIELEEQNNRAFINHYNLSTDFSHVVDEQEVTLNNADMKKDVLSYISFAVGCIFGRYSIEQKGLILANESDTIENYLKQVNSPLFMPDEDNVIPIIDFELEKNKDEYWFEDDITERFKEFLKVTFGEEHFEENIRFIEEAIGKDIKKYFVKDFYADHVQRYKKRPIYWLFSSPKGSFNALIYMHRYQPDTVSIVLNDYLREFRTKLEARKESYEQVEISVSASQKDITQAIKAIAKIDKVLEEVNDYEHDVLYPLAGKKIEIDLDDGVKHNYPLFGKALKKVTGLS